MFQRRHYEFLARFFEREITVSNSPERKQTIEGLVRLIASELARDNRKFNADRFRRVAGELKGEK